jgi:IS605 OrfB family transposase
MNMQTISLPYRVTNGDPTQLMLWRRFFSAAVRSGYRAAGTGAPEKEIRDGLKQRFAGQGIDAWLLHCATREALDLRKRVPDGSMVFGGKKNLERRRKGLITNAEWKALRLRPLTSLGDSFHKGNRHFRLSEDGRNCELTVLGTKLTLGLPVLAGKWAKMLPAVVRLAAAKEINVTFRIANKTLDITFDEMDMRKLPPGVTLRAAKDAEIAAGMRVKRGRPRSDNYVVPKLKDIGPRFMHPEWRDPVRAVSERVLGVDLNQDWIGGAVIENSGDITHLSATNLLEHQLFHLGLEADASDESVRELLAKICDQLISIARSWNCSVIAMEQGLGKLHSGGKNKALNRKLNGWARSVFEQMLCRRCRLAGIQLELVWCAYSTTIGNLTFAAPDACAAAAEIGRRALALRAMRAGAILSEQGLLPVFEPETVPIPWKDEVRLATTWVEAHGAIKTAQATIPRERRVGYRRPHYDTGTLRRDPTGRTTGLALAGHAVVRLGHKHRPGLALKPVRTGEMRVSAST